MSPLLIASTCAPYKMQAEPEEAYSWLKHADAWVDRGHEFFLAAEHGARLEAMTPLEVLVEELTGTVWSFSIDDGEKELTSGGRLVRICTGRNLAHEAFNRHPGRWEAILFLDTDVEPPEDAPERLLEVAHELVGFNVPTYCLDGPRLEQAEVAPGRFLARTKERVLGQGPTSWSQDGAFFPDGADVRMHWNTAGALMVRDHAARHLRWRYDLSRGQTDDPCFQEDAVRAGYGQTWVRHDVVGRHHPETIAPLEARGLDLRL